MSASSTLTHTPISVNFNVSIDASGNIEIFSSSSPILNNVIVAEHTLFVGGLYDEALSRGLIELWEPSNDQGKIHVQLADSDQSLYGGPNFLGAYQSCSKVLAEQLQTVLCDSFDCSGATPFNLPNYKAKVQYYKQRDFGRVALATYAHYMFGHVDATAAITNDRIFVKSMLSINAAEQNETSEGAEERAAAWTKKNVITENVQTWNANANLLDANLAIRLVKAIVQKGLTNNTPTASPIISVVDKINGTDPTSLANIVNQVVGQDISRLMNVDNSERTLNRHMLLRFYPGDLIYMNITLKPPSINIGGTVQYPSQQKVTPEMLQPLYSEKNFTLKFTLGGVSEAYVTTAVNQTIDALTTAPSTVNITELKSLLGGFTTANPAPVPTITVPNVPITSLVTTSAPSFNSTITYEVNFVLLTNNAATISTTALVENSVLYLPVTQGTPIALVADSVSYTIITSGSNISVNGTTFTLGQKVLIGAKTFVVAFTGSVGLIVQNASPGIAKMATRIGGTPSFQTANIITDHSGNVYIRYQTSDTSSHILYNYSSAPVNGGQIATSIYGTISGFLAYLVKYNNSGIIQWVTAIPTSGSHSGSVATMACDSVGNIYLVGQASSNVTPHNFTSGPVNQGAVTLTSWGTIPSAPNQAQWPNVWIIKYNPSGSVLWGTMIKGNGESLMPQCSVDSNDNLIMVYNTWQDPLTMYNYTSAPVNRGTVGLTIYGTIKQPSYAYIIIKYSPSGSVSWATHVLNTMNDAFAPSAVTCDSSGNIYMFGGCSNNKVVAIKNYSSPPVAGGLVGLSNYGTITITNSNRAGLIVKYNSFGTVIWATYISGSFGLTSYISCDSSNNLYLVSNGQMGSLFNYNTAPVSAGAVGLTLYGIIPNSPDWARCFIAKYNSSGKAQWATRFLGAATTLGRSVCDLAGNVYVTVRANREAGSTIIPFNYTSAPVNQGTIGLTQYGLVPFYDPVTWPGKLDTFILKYNTNGTCAWVTRIGGILDENFGELAIDTNDNLFFVGGYASNPVYISNFVAKPATPTSNITLEHYGTLADVNTSAGTNILFVKFGV